MRHFVLVLRVWALQIAAAVSLISAAPAAAAVHLLLETDVDSSGGSELFLVSYADLASLTSDPDLSAVVLPQNVGAGFSVAGFDIDNGMPYLLLETDADAAAGSELFLVSYADLSSLTSSPDLSAVVLPQNVGNGFSVAGFDITTDVAPVPEPSAWAMMLLGFGIIGWTMRRRPSRSRKMRSFFDQ